MVFLVEAGRARNAAGVGWWHLKRVYWFLWRDAEPDAPTNCSFCKSSGLFRSDFTPKPAWNAFLKITHH